MENQTTNSSPSAPPTCSPSRATIDMHRALQFIRPLLIAVQGDDASPGFRKSRATAAIAACDTAMITADMDYPEFDFYSENAEVCESLPRPQTPESKNKLNRGSDSQH